MILNSLYMKGFIWDVKNLIPEDDESNDRNMSTQEHHKFTFKDVPQDFQTITKKLEKISIKYEKEINKIIFNKLCIIEL